MDWSGILVGLGVVLGLIIIAIFTIWMLSHAILLTATMWPKQRYNAVNVALLILFLIGGGFVGALVYFFVRYLKAKDFEIV